MGFFDFFKKNKRDDWEEEETAEREVKRDFDAESEPFVTDVSADLARRDDIAKTIDEVQASGLSRAVQEAENDFDAGKPAIDPSYMNDKVMDFIRGHSAEEITKAAGSFTAQGMKSMQEQDFARAAELLELGAQMGDAKAQALIGSMYVQGYEMPQDLKIGRAWLGRSAAQGNEKAAEMLKKYENDFEPTAKELYASAQAAEKDHFRAHYLLRAAEMGHSAAQFEYGTLLTGAADEDTQKKGIEWLKRAAFGGYAAAMTALGKAYAAGNVVPQSTSIAREWLEQAAKKGDDSAKEALEELQ